MNLALSRWSRMTVQQRVVVVLATIAMLVAFAGIARLASKPTMSLLFSGLEPAAAGDIVASLDQRGVVYEVRGSAIYVEQSVRDPLRLSLAGEGLPATGGQGAQ